MDQGDKVRYEDFLMWADCWRLAESGEWRGRVNIMRKNGSINKQFIIKNTFKTKQEAVDHSLEYGKLIIDGKIPDCFV